MRASGYLGWYLLIYCKNGWRHAAGGCLSDPEHWETSGRVKGVSTGSRWMNSSTRIITTSTNMIVFFCFFPGRSFNETHQHWDQVKLATLTSPLSSRRFLPFPKLWLIYAQLKGLEGHWWPYEQSRAGGRKGSSSCFVKMITWLSRL